MILKCLLNKISGHLNLGNFVGPDVTNNFIKTVNYMQSIFCKSDFKVKYKLLKSYCVQLYGSNLWDYPNNKIDYFIVQWRKCIRKVRGFPCNMSLQSVTFNL